MATPPTGGEAPVGQTATPREEECTDQGPNEIDFILHKEIDGSSFFPMMMSHCKSNMCVLKCYRNLVMQNMLLLSTM